MQFAVNAAPARYDIISHLTLSASGEGRIYRHIAAECKVLSGRPTVSWSCNVSSVDMNVFVH